MNTKEGVSITLMRGCIGDLEDKIVEITTAEQNKEKRLKRIEDSLRDLWDNIKRINIRIIGVKLYKDWEGGPLGLKKEL